MIVHHPSCNLGATGLHKSVPDVIHMSFRGAFTDDQLFSDLLVCQVASNCHARLRVRAQKASSTVHYMWRSVMAEDVLERLVTEAIRLGADTLEVEYKDGYEQVFAVSGPLGLGITRFRSSSPDGARIRNACFELAQLKNRRRITVSGHEYELRCAIYDSFGEDAFRISLRQVSRTSSGSRSKAPRGRNT